MQKSLLKRVAAFLVQPANLDHLFFLSISLAFVVFVFYYMLVYKALWNSIQ